ncbi:MAG TPA: AsmA family protein [Xanthobacteraceae bacterium]|nr:AsmA family protein [Xanthobacteraceae bacterium]
MNVVIRIKRIAIAMLLAAIGGLCVLLILPYTVPRHEIRAAVLRSLEAATGITPHIGAMHFSVLPQPGLRLDDVRFESGDNDLTAGSLKATIRILPLLIGEVEVASLAFDQAHLNIEFSPDGVRLLGLPLRRPPAASAGNGPEINLTNSVVDVRSVETGRAEKLSNVDASLAWSGTSLSMLSSLRWRGIPSDVSLHITNAGALGENARSPVRLRFENEIMRAGFEGMFAFRKGLQAEGALSLESRSLRFMLSSFGIDVPTRGGFGPLSLKSRAQITPSTITASNLAIELDGNRADGTLTLTLDPQRPALQGTLAADSADFSAYMNGFSLVSADKRGWNQEPLDIKPLAGFGLDLRLSAGKVVFGKVEASRVALAASVKDGKFTLSAGQGQIFGGLLRGTAAIGPAPDGTSVRIDATIQDFDSARGIGALTGNRHIEGNGSFAIALTGSGNSVNAITRDLRGNAELTVLDGSLAGVNIESALRTLSRKPLSALSELRGGRTPFNRFVTRIAINEGNAAFEQARIESGSVAVTLDGLASIPQRDLDLRGVASLVAPADAANGVALPFLVHGSWDSPRLSPDGPALLRRSENDSWDQVIRAAALSSR